MTANTALPRLCLKSPFKLDLNIWWELRVIFHGSIAGSEAFLRGNRSFITKTLINQLRSFLLKINCESLNKESRQENDACITSLVLIGSWIEFLISGNLFLFKSQRNLWVGIGWRTNMLHTKRYRLQANILKFLQLLCLSIWFSFCVRKQF